MTDIVDFVLARITEDASTARFALVDDKRRQRGSRALADNRAVHLSGERVLAECEAKRRVIAEWGAFETYNGEALLGVLAQPYADHPDFDPSWQLS